MKVKTGIRIQKKYLPPHKNTKNRDYVFPRMPQLYLELIENKDQIKPNLVNKQFAPKYSIVQEPVSNLESRLDDLISQHPESEHAVEIEHQSPISYVSFESSDGTSSRGSVRSESPVSIRTKSSVRSRMTDKLSLSYNSDDEEKLEDSHSQDLSIERELPIEISERPPVERHERHLERPPVDRHAERERYLERPPVDRHAERERYSERPAPVKPISNQDELSRNLNMVFGKSSHTDVGTRTSAPTLEQLNLNHRQTIPVMTDDDIQIETHSDETELKRELLFKFETMKKKMDVPEFTIFSDYNTMKQSYEALVRRTTIDKNVIWYRTQLCRVMMFVEFFLSYYMGFDMYGFTQEQQRQMDSYDDLLLELGEKSWISEESHWPVELRLVFVIVTNVASFLAMKTFEKKLGSSFSNIMGNFTNTADTSSKSKKKMKGPNFNLSELP